MKSKHAKKSSRKIYLQLLPHSLGACMVCALVGKKRSWTARNRSWQNRSSEMAKTQTLSFPIRLSDAMQAEALRLLNASRTAINQIIPDLWFSLDLFAADPPRLACTHATNTLLQPSRHQ